MRPLRWAPAWRLAWLVLVGLVVGASRGATPVAGALQWVEGRLSRQPPAGPGM